jgi:hypothetical protein
MGERNDPELSGLYFPVTSPCRSTQTTITKSATSTKAYLFKAGLNGKLEPVCNRGGK